MTPERVQMPEEYVGADLVALALKLDRYESSHGRDAVNVDARFLDALGAALDAERARAEKAEAERDEALAALAGLRDAVVAYEGRFRTKLSDDGEETLYVFNHHDRMAFRAQFDAALAAPAATLATQHDARVRAAALLDAADRYERNAGAVPRGLDEGHVFGVGHWLRALADEAAKGAGRAEKAARERDAPAEPTKETT